MKVICINDDYSAADPTVLKSLKKLPKVGEILEVEATPDPRFVFAKGYDNGGTGYSWDRFRKYVDKETPSDDQSFWRVFEYITTHTA